MRHIAAVLIVLVASSALALPPSSFMVLSPGSGGGGGGDAATIDGLEGNQLITTSTTTNTTALTMAVASTACDITSAAATELRVCSSGAASINQFSGDGNYGFFNSAGIGGPEMLVSVQDSNVMRIAMPDSVAALNMSTNGTFLGLRTDGASTAIVGGVGDSIAADGTSVKLLTVYGGGKSAPLPQAAACAAGVLALDPTSDVVNIDANGAACVVTLAEGNAIVNSTVEIRIVTASAGGGVTFPDVANIAALDSTCNTTGLQLGGKAICGYRDESNDQYRCHCFAAP